MDRHISPRLGVAVLLAALALGCQPSQPEGSAEAPAPDAAPSAEARQQAPGSDSGMQSPLPADMPTRDTTVVDTVIDEVKLSAEGDTEQNTLGPPTTSFAPQDPVYAEVRTNGTANAYTIYAKWIGADGVVLADYGIHVDEAGPKRTVISLSKPDGWAPGENRIELAVNGRTLRTVTFRVQ